MGAKTLTISISEEDFDYLKSDGLLSPSKIFQVALSNLKDNRANLQQELQRKRVQAEKLQQNLTKATEFIDKCGLWEKFISTEEIKI